MKKTAIMAFMAIAITGGAFAQKNVLLGGVGGMINLPLVAGVEVYIDYERRIIPQFAVGATFSGQFFPFAIFAIAGTDGKIDNVFGYTIEAQARLYPFGGTFHLDAGVGFDHFLTSMPCFVITGDLGWNIAFGKSPVRLNIEPIHIEVFIPIGDNPLKYQPLNTNDWEEIKPFNVGLRIGLGYAF